MPKEEWDGLPWWETMALIEGLEAEEILKKPNTSTVDITG